MGAIPVVLFAYARPQHLARVLECLRRDRVPRIIAFADGPKGLRDEAAVGETRALLRTVDWADVRIVERQQNHGLGRNVLEGVTEVARSEDSFIVWEDDLICAPGTYDWLCAALRHYADEPQVMSVTAWTHPELVPAGVGRDAYLDERAEGWVWGTYARSWRGMDQSARAKASIAPCRPSRLGADLPLAIMDESRRAVWSARWLCHHLLTGGLCLRPARSLVEHIGIDAGASNAAGDNLWANPPLVEAASLPASWPAPSGASGCLPLWREAVWRRMPWRRRIRSLVLRAFHDL